MKDLPNKKKSKKFENSDIVKKVRNSDPDAFKKLFELYSHDLLDFSYYYVKNRKSAEDIVQEVFVKIWKSREKLDTSLSIKAYLFKSTQNISLNILRHEKIARMDGDLSKVSTDEKYSSEEILILDERQDAVSKAISELPKKSREIIMLSTYSGLTNPQIAKHLNVSINTVKTLKVRAFKFLRKQLSYLSSLISL